MNISHLVCFTNNYHLLFFRVNPENKHNLLYRFVVSFNRSPCLYSLLQIHSSRIHPFTPLFLILHFPCTIFPYFTTFNQSFTSRILLCSALFGLNCNPKIPIVYPSAWRSIANVFCALSNLLSLWYSSSFFDLILYY